MHHYFLLLALIWPHAFDKTTFTFKWPTTFLLKKTSSPLDCLKLSTLLRAKLYCVESLTAARKSSPDQFGLRTTWWGCRA